MFRRLFRKRNDGSKGGTSTNSDSAGGGSGQAHLVVPTVGRAPQPTTLDAIQKLSEMEDLLTQRRELLEKKAAHELGRARQLAKQGSKKSALASLRRKHLYESQLEHVDQSLLRLGEQQAGLEGLHATAQAVAALRTGAAAGRAAVAEFGAGAVDTLLDEVAQQADEMREVQGALGQPLGEAAELDDEELLGELQELEAAQQGEPRPAATPAPRHTVPQALPQAAGLPAAPSTPAAPPQREQQQPQSQAKSPDDQELEALEKQLVA